MLKKPADVVFRQVRVHVLFRTGVREERAILSTPTQAETESKKDCIMVALPLLFVGYLRRRHRRRICPIKRAINTGTTNEGERRRPEARKGRSCLPRACGQLRSRESGVLDVDYEKIAIALCHRLRI